MVILIDGVDTRAVPEHRASPHTDITNFREQIIMACVMINLLWENGNIVNTYELADDVVPYSMSRLGLGGVVSVFSLYRHKGRMRRRKLIVLLNLLHDMI